MRRAVLVILGLVVLSGLPASSDDSAILRAVEQFFATDDPDRREELVRQIQRDPTYQRADLSRYLHRARLFDQLDSGPLKLEVSLGERRARRVVLRIPHGYAPTKKWPLIYALHGSGGNAENILEYYERVLGRAVNQYVLAAPDHYDEVIVLSERPEHLAVLREIKRRVRVDSERVYVTGYSMGGHTSWTLVVLHPDEFAAAVPIAGSLSLPGVDRLWPTFLPNVQNTYVLQVWGGQDRLGDDGQASSHGGIAGTNRKLRDVVAELQLPVDSYEDPDKAHGDVVPPRDVLLKALRRERVACPAKVQHTFRRLHEAHAYWLEGHTWQGEAWDRANLGRVELRPDEDPGEALYRAIRARLGELRGEIIGQRVDVRRKHVGELTVWLSDGMIDWTQPLTVNVSGRQVFEGVLEPDLFVCLTQAARTRDFERLRWAGLRCRPGQKAEVETGHTAFPQGSSDSPE